MKKFKVKNFILIILILLLILATTITILDIKKNNDIKTTASSPEKGFPSTSLKTTFLNLEN